MSTSDNKDVRAQLQQIVGADPINGWDMAWYALGVLDLNDIFHRFKSDYTFRQQNVTPWDRGHVQPPLRDLLLSNQINWPRNGKALVPGCGRVWLGAQDSWLNTELAH